MHDRFAADWSEFNSRQVHHGLVRKVAHLAGSQVLRERYPAGPPWACAEGCRPALHAGAPGCDSPHVHQCSRDSGERRPLVSVTSGFDSPRELYARMLDKYTALMKVEEKQKAIAFPPTAPTRPRDPAGHAERARRDGRGPYPPRADLKGQPARQSAGPLQWRAALVSAWCCKHQTGELNSHARLYQPGVFSRTDSISSAMSSSESARSRG